MAGRPFALPLARPPGIWQRRRGTGSQARRRLARHYNGCRSPLGGRSSTHHFAGRSRYSSSLVPARDTGRRDGSVVFCRSRRSPTPPQAGKRGLRLRERKRTRTRHPKASAVASASGGCARQLPLFAPASFVSSVGIALSLPRTRRKLSTSNSTRHICNKRLPFDAPLLVTLLEDLGCLAILSAFSKNGNITDWQWHDLLLPRSVMRRFIRSSGSREAVHFPCVPHSAAAT